MDVEKRIDFSPAINVTILDAGRGTPDPIIMNTAASLLGTSDRMITCGMEDGGALQDADLVIVSSACGSTPLSAVLATLRVPCVALNEYQGFHPYHAAFTRDIERRGGIALPACTPDQIATSIRAVRAAKALHSIRLLVVDPHEEGFRADEIEDFRKTCAKTLGIDIRRRSTEELIQMADGISEIEARAILSGWYETVLEYPSEMSEGYMLEVARLYAVERRMLAEVGASGLTVNDIGGFLLRPEPHVMPNISYGPLVSEGFLVAEEADIEVLTTELLMYAGLGAHPTMSNIYLAYRDRFGGLADADQYTPEMELEDLRQCIADNHVTAAHFSLSGILPPDMRTESCYRVRGALSWKGQGMIAATPRLGPVLMARIGSDAKKIHLVPGVADGLGFGDQYGWYRGRWFIRIPSVYEFIRTCQHQHYAITRNTGDTDILHTLLVTVLGLELI